MTLVNLISNVVSPDYSCLYMIRSEIMVEAERVGGRLERDVAQMVSLFPNYVMQLGDPAWSGLTRRDIQISITRNSTSSETFVFDMVMYLLDLILARKNKKPSAKDAEVIRLMVISQSRASSIHTNHEGTSVTEASLLVDPSTPNSSQSSRKEQ